MSSAANPKTCYIGPRAAARLAAYCADYCKGSLRIIADRGTWKAMGEEVQKQLQAAGLKTRPLIFDDTSLVADQNSIFRLFIDPDPSECLYIAVGSGTITDIVRFASHRMGLPFISVATAASVDAYASIVAPIVIDGTKKTVPAQAPLAVFADSEVLSLAPKAMTAAGFGDMLCKFSAVADWRLGSLFWEEVYDENLGRRSVTAARRCADEAANIGLAKPKALVVLMEGLLESGRCMAEAGNSYPASGAEHQYSHFWEMRLLSEHRPPILHGLKVGIGTVEAARLWEAIRSLEPDEAERRLHNAKLPERQGEELKIRSAYRESSESIISLQGHFLEMKADQFLALKAKIQDSWKQILEIAATIPGLAETRKLLAEAGCPTDARQLGLNDSEIHESLQYAHYIRDRFTVKKLALLLGIE